MTLTHETRRFRRSLVAAAFAVAGTLTMFVGCGDGRPPVSDDGTAGAGAGSSHSSTCEPALEGRSVACHVETGRVGTYVNCFHGVQVCRDGVWSPCGGDQGTLTTLSLDFLSNRRGGGLGILAGSSSASGCAANPCNPNCRGEDVDAGGLTPGSFSSTSILGTVTTPELFPGGPNGPKNAMGSTWNSTSKTWACSNAGTAPPGTQAGHPPASYQTCSSDYCCASTGAIANTCQPWVVANGDNANAASCIKTAGSGSAGIDFTVGLSCTDTSGVVHVPVCNRGTTDATSGVLHLAGYAGNPNYAGAAAVCDKPGSPSDLCRIDLSVVPLRAGKCMDVNGAAAFAGSLPGVTCSSNLTGGNTTMMVNPPNTAGAPQLPEGDLCNNYGFRRSSAQTGTCSAYGVQPPPPVSSTSTFTASCPAGHKVVWNQFAYSVSPSTGAVGADYDVAFNFMTSTGVTKTVRAKNKTNYPSTCAFSAVTSPACTSAPPPDSPCNTPPVAPATAYTCPTNLSTLLGAGASAPSLTLSLALSPGATTSPVVNSWSITYNCIPNE